MNPQEQAEVLTSAQELWNELFKLGTRLMQPWTLYQLFIILGIVVFCTLIARIMIPKCGKWKAKKVYTSISLIYF